MVGNSLQGKVPCEALVKPRCCPYLDMHEGSALWNLRMSDERNFPTPTPYFKIRNVLDFLGRRLGAAERSARLSDAIHVLLIYGATKETLLLEVAKDIWSYGVIKMERRWITRDSERWI